MEAAVDKVGYTGHRYDSSTGLVYAGARMYDPVLGRFMGIDPVSALEAVNNPVMFNRYAYGNNNPYKYVDPDGENPLAVLVLFVGLVTLSEIANTPDVGEEPQKLSNFDYASSFLGAGFKPLRGFRVGRGSSAPKKASPLDGTTFTDKVKRQMNGKDTDHNFPTLVDKHADAASVKKIIGSDGVERTKVELPGSINGKDGNFSWIIEPDKTINHRQFERLKKK